MLEASPLERRALLGGAAAIFSLIVTRPVLAANEALPAAVRELVGEAPVGAGRVHLDIPPLVENGNSVPVTIAVEAAMSAAEFVRRIALFNTKNPQAEVAVFHLGPTSARPTVSTRMRLATSQTVIAVAELSDGSFWSDRADVIVTLAACVEG